MNPTLRPLVFTLSLLLTLGAALATEEWDGVSGEPPADEPEPAAAAGPQLFGPIAIFSGPESLNGMSTTVNFDDARHHDAVNDLYAEAGLRLERDDGYVVHAYDWARLGYETSSPPMVACTTRGPGAPLIASALNLVFDDDVRTAGFVVGNDVYPRQWWTIEVYDAADRLIGRLSFLGNSNVSADEFIGVTSVVPFRRLRLSHYYRSYAVCLDDVVFSTRATTSF